MAVDPDAWPARRMPGGDSPWRRRELERVFGVNPAFDCMAGNLDVALAQAHFQQALAILELQRSTLPVEEIRTAFLDDKSEIYVDLVQLLLELADEDPTLMAVAFVNVSGKGLGKPFADGDFDVNDNILLMAGAIACGVLALGNIFLFKNRKLQ